MFIVFIFVVLLMFGIVVLYVYLSCEELNCGIFYVWLCKVFSLWIGFFLGFVGIVSLIVFFVYVVFFVG